MFGDDDPDIAPFFAEFLGERTIRPVPSATRKDGRVRQPRYTADSAPLTNGLALGLAGAEAILEQNAAPKKRVFSKRTQTFHKMLEDMANGIQEHGPDAYVMPSREATPRSSISETPLVPVRPVAELAEPLPRSFPPVVSRERNEDPHWVDEPEAESEASSDDSIEDAVDITESPMYPRKYPPTDFGATLPPDATPPNHIKVSVVLKSGKRILDTANIDLDSSLEDLFERIEAKIGKSISVLITRHGMKLERADLPMRWSGLQDGDTMTAMHKEHPSPNSRHFEVVSASLDSLAAAKLNPKFSNSDAVTMGAFGDTIAQTAGAYPSSQAAKKNHLFKEFTAKSSELPDHWSDGFGRSADEPEGADLPDYWSGGLGLTTLLQQGGINLDVVPPVPPRSSQAVPVPAPPICMPDEFEDLPEDAFLTPHGDAGAAGEVTQQRLFEGASPSKPRQPRKAAESPPPPTAAALGSTATPTSSRLGDLSFAPTPSRRPLGPSGGQPRSDAAELQKKLEEKQKQNDAIWANIAASLEPAQLEPTKRTFLSHAASAGSLSRKMQPLSRRQR